MVAGKSASRNRRTVEQKLKTCITASSRERRDRGNGAGRERRDGTNQSLRGRTTSTEHRHRVREAAFIRGEGG